MNVVCTALLIRPHAVCLYECGLIRGTGFYYPEKCKAALTNLRFNTKTGYWLVISKQLSVFTIRVSFQLNNLVETKSMIGV